MALSASLYRAWLKHLRTGKKAQRRLVDPCTGGKCCLGHLAVAAGFTPDRWGHIDGHESLLTTSVRGLIGLPSAAQDSLATANDVTEGFGEVIKLIRVMRKKGEL